MLTVGAAAAADHPDVSPRPSQAIAAEAVEFLEFATSVDVANRWGETSTAVG